MDEEDIRLMQQIGFLLMKAGKTTNYAVSMAYRRQAIELARANIHLIKYVDATELGRKLRATGFMTQEIQKIIRGVGVIQNAMKNVAAASGVIGETIEMAGVGTTTAEVGGGFMVICGVSLTATQALVVVAVCLAIVLGAVLGGWLLGRALNEYQRNNLSSDIKDDYFGRVGGKNRIGFNGQC